MGNRRAAFTMLELVIALATVGVVLAMLLPALSTARVSSHRALCSGNQRLIGEAWHGLLEANENRFPILYVQPAWRYGGVRFSSVDGRAVLDYNRPLNRYLPVHRLHGHVESVFECPADRGITDEHGEIGTGRRTAFDAFGTSYRANARLLGPATDGQGLDREEITTAPSRLVVMGDPVWYEVLASTGRLASWHDAPDAGNLLFLDGSVRFVRVEPQPAVGPAVFDPVDPELLFPLGQ